MIQYDKDGATLLDGAGNRVTVFDSGYSGLLGIMDAQISVITENTQAAANYTQAVANAQVSINAGRPYPALPDKPRQKVVSDTGAVSYVVFAPPLPDVVPQVVTAPSSGSIKADVPDQQAIMYAMLTAIYRKMFPGG
jgi:hypothetical protein